MQLHILNSKNIFGNLILALAVEQGYINCFSIEEFYQKFYNDGEELEEPVPLDFLEVLSKLKEQLDVKSFINKNEVTEYSKRSFKKLENAHKDETNFLKKHENTGNIIPLNRKLSGIPSQSTG